MLSRALRFADVASLMLAWIAAGLIVAVTALIIGEVLLRAVLNVSLPFVWELCSFGGGLAMVLGMPYTFRSGGHVQVKLVQQWASPRLASRLDFVVMAAGLVVVVWITYAVAQMAASSYRMGAVSFATGIPLAVPQAVLTAGFAVASLQLLAMLVRLIRGERQP